MVRTAGIFQIMTDALPDSFADAPTGSASDPVPPFVKIGWRTYRIEVWSPRQGISANRYGETAFSEGRISIDLQYGTRQAAQTLLHEIFHGVHEAWKLAVGDEEERIVSAFGCGMSTVWRDNPDVLAWIGRHLVSGDD